MGNWTKDGQYTPGKLEAAQIEKNRWKRRASIAENRLRQIRNILLGDAPEDAAINAIVDAIDAWEHDCPDVGEDMVYRK